MAKRKAVEAATVAPPTLEELLTAPLGFRLAATPVQRAICRAIDGQPLGDLADDPNVVRAFGGPTAVAALPSTRPREVYLIAGIRGGKSMIAAAAAILATQTVDLSMLSVGDLVRVSVVSLTVDTAKAVYNHVRDNVLASPPLRALLVDEPTSDAVVLRHPSGRPIEIKIVAGSKAGGTLVARWNAAVIFDEAPRMAGDEAVVNFGDARAAVLGRLLPGAPLLALGSPWAPQGPIYDTVTECFGAPTPERVVIRAPAYVLNPVWWTPERVESFRTGNPELARTDVDAEFGIAAGASFFVESDFELLFREDAATSLAPGDRVAAAVDLGFVRNSATLAILAQRDAVASVVHLAERRPEPTRALVPSEVCASFAAQLQGHHVKTAVADGYYRETLREHTDAVSVSLYDSCGPGERFLALRSAIRAGTVRCHPALPEAQRLRRQMGTVRPRLAPNGSLSVVLPEDTDGSHCDVLDVLARAVWGLHRYGAHPVPAPPPEDLEEDRLLRALEKRAREKERTPWYRRTA